MNYKNFKRIFVIVADSLGAGYSKDSANYGDYGTNTITHLSESIKDFSIPTLQKLGLANITKVNNNDPIDNPLAIYGKLEEESVGKDTLTGHWEMMGLNVKQAFPSFTDTGFPQELIDEIKKLSGRDVIGNIAASGTEIIKDMGEEQMKTGALIVYTSSDSVLQIAAHEDIIPIEELYDICDKVRKITLENPKWSVGRIIARPYIGTCKDDFKRTPRRHDYAVSPNGLTTLDYLKEANYSVISVGKIFDIFNGNGLTESNKIVSNHDGMLKTMEIAKRDFTGLCFVNLVDFDAVYGHRRDAVGYAKCVMEFDEDIKNFMELLNDDDLLIITADHGNDPTWTGTDHTRENVPVLIYNKNIKSYDLGMKHSFAWIGKTISDNFNVKSTENGQIFDIELK